MNDADTLTRLTLGPLPGSREPQPRTDRVAGRAQASVRPAPVSRVRPHVTARVLDGDDEVAASEPSASEQRDESVPLRAVVLGPPLRSVVNAASERASTGPLAPTPARAASPAFVERSRSVVETVERIVEPRLIAPAVVVEEPRARAAARPEAPQPVKSEPARVVRAEPVRAGSGKPAEPTLATSVERPRAPAPSQPSLASERSQPERAGARPQPPKLEPARPRAAESERVQPPSTPRASGVERASRPATPNPSAEEAETRPVAKLARVAVDASVRASEVRPRRVAVAEPRPVAIAPRPVARGPIAAPRPTPAPASVRVSVGRIEIRTTPSARTPTRRAPAPARAHAITPVLPGAV
ncbi:MAG TPA: hypothetical protein VM869_03455 [Enhygromyxa sp.]|nr:hypothetical protein [Enhygromyxa sp.]